MDHLSMALISVIIAGVAFDFVNGFHDAANSIATIIATSVLKPWQAVIWAATFNVMALFFFGTGVATTVGSGLISLETITPTVILCGFAGATLWGLVTWRLGLPTSSSHALLGGYAGAAMGHSVIIYGYEAIDQPIIMLGWLKVLIFIIIAPIVGLLLAQSLMKLWPYGERRFAFMRRDRTRRALQLLSSAFLSLMHGSNDAQKTAGILTGALVSGGVLPTFIIPSWILILSYVTMGLGTLFGGWRIVKTMGHDLTPLTPKGAVCAESASALAILGATSWGLPISTTQVTTGAILGVGISDDPRQVQWPLGQKIAWSWIITIPAAAFMGFCIMAVLARLGV